MVALVLAFGNMAVWSLATPFGASPDEPAHIERAVALDHGTLIGRTYKNVGNAITRITVPKLYAAESDYGSCFTFKSLQPATCAKPLTNSTKEDRTITYVGRYPPLYYAIVGLPSVFGPSHTTIYFMRLVSALLNALFLALAVTAVATWSRRRYLLIGVVVAATPMTFFLGSVVNPSGFEISTALCLWCAGLVLALERADRPPPGLVAVVVAATVGLLLARGLSPLWVAVIVALLALLAGWRRLRSLARDRSIRRSQLVLVPASAFAVVWIVWAHALDLLPVGAKIPKSESDMHLALSIFGNTYGWLQQMVGVFGWLDTPSPSLTYLIWFAAVGLLLFMALGSARFRGGLVIVVILVVVVFAPVLISYLQADRLGVIWQARYIMPIAVGLPLTCAALIEEGAPGRFSPRLATTVCAVLATAQLAAFAQALRRYTVGATGSLNYFHSRFQPPFGALTLTVAAGVLLVLLMAFVRTLIGIPPGPEWPDSTPAPIRVA